MQKMMRAAFALLVALSLLLGAALAEETPVLQIHQIDVGCADCYLMICGDAAFLVDCGIDQERTALKVDEYLAAAGFGKLDAVFITHYHRDHVRNLNRVLSIFGDENTVIYGPTQQMFRDYVPLANGTYRQLKHEDEIMLGGVSLTCLGPVDLKGAGNVNKDSLNILMTYGSRRVLFTGDFVRSVDIIRLHEDRVKELDVLKFPHHGLEPFTVDAWALEIMDPELIFVPGYFGDNVERLLRKRDMQNSRVLDTTNGEVVLLTDGESLEVFTRVEMGQFAQ